MARKKLGVLGKGGLLTEDGGAADGSAVLLVRQDYVAPSSDAAAALATTRSSRGSPGVVLSATPRNLYSLHAYSSAACLLVITDAAALPAAGTTLVNPVFIFAIPAGGSIAFDWSLPVRFPTGVVAAFSTDAQVYTPSSTGFVAAQVA